jgi:xylulokinase
VVTGMAGPTLLWLREHEPDTYAAARWAMQPKDWLRLQLTGRAAAEPSDASATLLYDLPADDWAWSLVDRLGLRDDLLPPLVASAGTAGTLTTSAADALGLRPGLVVAAGAGDTPAAALGSGLVDPGPLQLTIGTGGQVLAPRDRPVADPTRRTHIYRAAATARWYAMGATLNAGLALEWVRRVLAVDWATLYDEAFAVAPGADGARFLPYLGGERTPHLDAGARGAWTGLGIGHHRGHLLRAALEGVAFALRDCVAAIEAAGPDRADKQLRLAGGGTVVPAWRQLLADVLRRPLAAVDTPNASVRGAALLSGIAAEVYPNVHATLALAPSPRPVAVPGDAADAYEPAYEQWRAIYPRLRDGGS